MNKLKNKSLYRLIPIKVITFVVLALKNKKCHLSVDSVILFYIYTIIYSFKISFKPEWVSFFCWTYMLFWRMWKTKQLLVLSDLHSIFFLLSKTMSTSNCLVFHILQNYYRFGTTCEGVNHDWNVIIGWTIPLMTVGCVFNSVLLRPAC